MAKKKTKQKSKADKYFLLTWKKLLLVIGAWIIAVILHNLVSGILGVEEALFFIIAIFVIPIYFLVMIVYSLVKAIIRGTQKFG